MSLGSRTHFGGLLITVPTRGPTRDNGTIRNTITTHSKIKKVFDRDYLKPDDELGRVELSLADLAARVDAASGARGAMEGWFPLGGRGGGRDGRWGGGDVAAEAGGGPEAEGGGEGVGGRGGEARRWPRGAVEMRVQYMGYE